MDLTLNSHALLQCLTDSQLQQFMQDDSIQVLGHQLDRNDLRIMYSFDTLDASLADKYEAHHENGVSLAENRFSSTVKPYKLEIERTKKCALSYKSLTNPKVTTKKALIVMTIAKFE